MHAYYMHSGIPEISNSKLKEKNPSQSTEAYIRRSSITSLKLAETSSSFSSPGAARKMNKNHEDF